MSNRLDQQREQSLQPRRIEHAKAALEEKGVTVHYQSETELRFFYRNAEIKLFPYSGWHTGKTIKDGRGLQNLLKQL